MRRGVRLRRAIERHPEWLSAAAAAGTYLLVRLMEHKRVPATRREAMQHLEPMIPPPAPAPRPRPKTGWPYWKDVLSRTYQEMNDDRLLALAAGVVFYALLALFPAIAAFVSSYALFAKPSTIIDHLSLIQSFLPAGAYKIVAEQVNRIVSSTAAGLSLTFVGGLLFALWSANAGIKAIIDALNIVYGARERRSFLVLNAVSLTFTVGAIVAMLLALGAVVILPVVLSYVWLDGYGKEIAAALRWPVMFGLLLLGLAVLYRFGPDLRNPQWRWISPGALLAAVLWIVGSGLLSWYLASYANYDATYGSLGAGIGLMTWLWLTSIAVLIGAELNSVIDEAEEGAPPAFPDAGPDRIGGL